MSFENFETPAERRSRRGASDLYYPLIVVRFIHIPILRHDCFIVKRFSTISYLFLN